MAIKMCHLEKKEEEEKEEKEEKEEEEDRSQWILQNRVHRSFHLLDTELTSSVYLKSVAFGKGNKSC